MNKEGISAEKSYQQGFTLMKKRLSQCVSNPIKHY